MWRLTGLVGRALPRSLGPGFQGLTTKSTRPDVCRATSSALLVPESNFNRSGPNGPKRNRGPRCHGWKDVYHWMSAQVSPNTLWDAISWGSLAVLAVHLARQIHFQASLATRPQPVERCSWHSPVTRFLSSPWWHLHASLRRNVLPGDSPAPRHTGLGELKLGQEGHSAQPRHFPSQNSLRAGLRDPPEEDPNDCGFLHASRGSTSKAKATEAHSPGVEKEQDKPKTLSLEEAVTSIQQLFELSVSIAFNFLGTENMKNEDYVAAFSCFQKAADRGYSKAQYNIGLCHEHGRGTPRDPGKAILYYHLAATQGHNLAKYRYARCLLREPGSLGHPEQQTAVCMLRQAADSGLREAQAFLGVLFTKEPHLDERKAVKYLWLAANSGDSQSWYHLGICYERGLGVQRNLGEAVKCYQQSAAMGNKPAQERLQTLFSMETTAPGPSHLATTGLKSFSSPSLCSLNTLLAGPSDLPHASSTGNLGLLCRSGHLGANLRDPSRGIPSLERSLVRLGFG